MNILFKEGGFVGEICEWGRFRSLSRETLLCGRLVQNEGELATMQFVSFNEKIHT